MSLKYGFRQIQRIPGGMASVAEHTFQLAKYLKSELQHLCYNVKGRPKLIQMYSKCDKIVEQGGICNFNILNSDGSHVGFTGINNY